MNKVEMPVSGGGAGKGKADGVAASPSDDAAVHGRTEGGESGGGAYPNPHSGKEPSNSGMMGHGGQTDIAYHGGPHAADNGAAGTGGVDGEDGASTAPSPEHAERKVSAAGQTFAVVETSGIAEAEANGKVGTDAPYEREQEAPGSG